MSHPHDTLTMGRLLAMAAALGPPLPRLRVIVGFPMVGESEAVECADLHLWLLGGEAWKKLKAACPPSKPIWEINFLDTIAGAPVEQYDMLNKEHQELFRKLLGSLNALRNPAPLLIQDEIIDG